MAVDHLMIDDEKVMLDDLTDEQRYYYNQMVEIKDLMEDSRKKFDRLQMAYKGFEDSLLSALKESIKAE